MYAVVKLAGVHTAQIERYLLRLATNFTARHNQPVIMSVKAASLSIVRKFAHLPALTRARPSRPLRLIEWRPGRKQAFPCEFEIWKDLVLPGISLGAEAKSFRVYAIYDPVYTTPWLLATSFKLKAVTVTAIYQDRWPVEQIPLSAKQMVGADRQLVHVE
jgi:hypothetical protein